MSELFRRYRLASFAIIASSNLASGTTLPIYVSKLSLPCTCTQTARLYHDLAPQLLLSFWASALMRPDACNSAIVQQGFATIDATRSSILAAHCHHSLECDHLILIILNKSSV